MTLNKVETITFQFTGIYYKNRIGWSCVSVTQPMHSIWESPCCFPNAFLGTDM